MTCIVGLVVDGTVYLGGDSRTTSGWDATEKVQPKVYAVGPLLLGSTGTCRVTQLLQYRLVVPPLPADQDWFRWVATDLTDAMRTCLKEGGHAKKDGEQEQAGGNTLLIGVGGRLFALFDDYGVVERAQGYDAVGCGAPYALGALYTLHADDHLTPADRVRQALTAAATFSAGVAPPFTVKESDAHA